MTPRHSEHAGHPLARSTVEIPVAGFADDVLRFLVDAGHRRGGPPLLHLPLANAARDELLRRVELDLGLKRSSRPAVIELDGLPVAAVLALAEEGQDLLAAFLQADASAGPGRDQWVRAVMVFEPAVRLLLRHADAPLRWA